MLSIFSTIPLLLFIFQAQAKRVGSPFYTLSDVLSDDERRYVEKKGSSLNDIDDLNSDIAKAALRWATFYVCVV
jgi:hypothetical protein